MMYEDEFEQNGHLDEMSDDFLASDTYFPGKSDNVPLLDSQSETDDDIMRKDYTVEEAVDYMGFGLFQIKFFLICGLFTATDALEMMLLSVLSPVLKCEWMLSEWHIAFLTTVVFIGMFAGSSMWGSFSDKYGRHPIVYIAACWICYFGVLTTFSPTYYWIIILRGIVGFAFGGAVQSYTLMSEYIPTKYRARLLVLTNINWAMGSMFETWLAYMTLPTLGWRYLVAFSALPSFISLFALWFLPESARYLVAAGKPEKAKAVLQQGFVLNRKAPLQGNLLSGTKSRRGRIMDLLHKNYLWSTLLLWGIWFGTAFSYYGLLLLNSELLESASYCRAPGSEPLVSMEECHCKLHTKQDYIDMMIDTGGEFIAIFLNLIMVDTLGRKYSLVIYFICTSTCYFLLLTCPSHSLYTVLNVLLRTFSSAIFNMTYLYTVEVYPTTMRSIGLGICSSFARLGSMSTPFIAQVLKQYSTRAAICVYGGLTLSCAIMAVFLPIETKGKKLKQNVSSTG